MSSPDLQALWLLPARFMVCGGVFLLICALLFLADLVFEHWRFGRETDDERDTPDNPAPPREGDSR
jgi:hypothetical protein